MDPTNRNGTSSPAISLPTGGGAIKGIGETFQPDLFTGTGNFTVPIPTSPGRSGFGPALSLQYSTGHGNGSFGLGWRLSVPRISRKTEKGLPRYEQDDVFVLSGAEDLVESSHQLDAGFQPPGYTVTRYRPRTEGPFARIEKWTRTAGDDIGDVHWRAITTNNTTSVYGKSHAARVTDPDNRTHTFEWLLEETYDAKGNHVFYEYVQENPDVRQPEVYEQNKRYTQTYLRRILYGNTPANLDPSLAVGLVRQGTHHRHPTEFLERHYVFEVFFDYGDLPDVPAIPHVHPSLQNDLIPTNWPVRKDRFSSFRAGFEVRTLRRCRRVLMLHHFTELASAPLVRSMDFEYEVNEHTQLSLLTAVQMRGFRERDGVYSSAAMPPITFRYSSFEPHKQRYQFITAKGDDLPPRPLTHEEFSLVDLFGDALPDIVQMTGEGYYYWRNLGGGTVDRRQRQTEPVPAVAATRTNVTFGDTGGDGLADLIVEPPPLAGFYESTPDGRWQRFKRFASFPSMHLGDANLRILDLTGDGLGDILITRDHRFLWFQSLGEQGYAEPKHISRVHDPNEFPDVYFDDPSGRVRLADMTGDGLTDIVLLHDGRIDYWPNLGYGRFGRRVTMARSPRLPADANPRQVFLVDLDGTGCADLVYVDHCQVHFWFNQSGNGWSAENTIQGTPYVSDASAIQFADFFGTGTASLVWSYDYAHQTPLNYVVLDFSGGEKPYLLTEMSNNMGATSRVRYAPSTKFYLEDKAAREPWATNLPFPVQVVEKSETIDHISRTKRVRTFKFHHGCYDGREREFRGFGRVDQCDTEEFDLFSGTGLHGAGIEIANNQAPYHVPPVLTKTWFHTGIYFDEDNVSPSGAFYDHQDLMRAYRHEFYQGDAQAFGLPNHVVEYSDTPHEAYRALRGSPIRTEVHGLDGTDREAHPYSVVEHRYRVKELQAKDGNAHPVYLRVPEEVVTYHYERQPADPRVTQVLSVAVNEYGQVTDSLSLAYPRRQPDPNVPEQAELKIVYKKSDFINRVDDPMFQHIGVGCQTRVYEVSGAQWAAGSPFLQAKVFSDVTATPEDFRPFEWRRSSGHLGLEKRLIEWNRSYFRTDASAALLDITRDGAGQPTRTLTSRLPLGQIEELALPYENFAAALTDDIIGLHFTHPAQVEPSILRQGGYHQEPDAPGYWWVPSGQQDFTPDAFYLSERTRDPFGFDSHLTVDRYALSPVESRDALGNATTAGVDYRVFQPRQIVGPNGHHGFVAFDALGMVVGSATRSNTGEGDTLDGFEADLSEQQIIDFLSQPEQHGTNLLQRATARIVYDLWAYLRGKGDTGTIAPAVAATLQREVHASDLQGDQAPPIQYSFVYSDGFGRTVQSKVRAEPDVATPDQARWVGTGTTVYNNKGKPVRQYEPFFADTHSYGIESHGVSPTLFYDPLERVVATLHPNHTLEKVVVDPWRQEAWDVNDTVLRSDPRTDPDVGSFFTKLPETDYLPSWHASRKDGQKGDTERAAAEAASAHADTPTVAHFDSLGRAVLTVANNAQYGKYESRVRIDIAGNPLEVLDAKGRIVTRSGYDLTGNRIIEGSMDAAVRWRLTDIFGKPFRSWDSRGHAFRTEYDELRRPTRSLVKGADPTNPDREILCARTVYGEAHPDSISGPGKLNLHGQIYMQLDRSGVVFNAGQNPSTSEEEGYDFKGNPLRSVRHLARDYKQLVDWTPIEPLLAVAPQAELDITAIRAALVPLLEAESFATSARFDALNRPAQVVAPYSTQGSSAINVIRPAYNEANLLDRVDVWTGQSAEPDTVLDLTSADLHPVKSITYDAKGQRERIEYGNGVETSYEYDPATFRLTHLLTRRASAAFPSDCPNPANPPCGVQNLRYTYDPAGNITSIRDDAQQAVYFNGQVAAPHNEYTYDAIYRLIEARGREHVGQLSQPETTWQDEFRLNLEHPHDGSKMRPYTEKYAYDECGNMLSVIHQANNGSWTRTYDYSEPSLVESEHTNNRLSSSTVGTTTDLYPYDEHGNMTQMPHLTTMEWNSEDQLHHLDLQGGGEAWMTYDAAGERVRKVVEKNNGTLIEERIYLSGFEVFRRRKNGSTTLERQTLHVIDGTKRVAMVEIKTRDTEDDPSPAQLVRYQLGNHLGSASLEVDDGGRVTSYEEYFPYGSTAYQAVDKSIKAAAKRYRYVGKERDEETGFYYKGARYYLPWLMRWTAADPAGLVDTLNVYSYGQNNPVRFVDPSGLQSLESSWPSGKELDRAWEQQWYGRGDGMPGDEFINRESRPAAEPQRQPKRQAKPPSDPKAETPTLSASERLHWLIALHNLKYRYQPAYYHITGAFQAAGGLLELVGAAGMAGTGAGLAPGALVGAVGLDNLQAGIRSAIFGEPTPTALYELGSGLTMIATDDPEWAHVGGTAMNIAGNVGSGAISLRGFDPPSPPVQRRILFYHGAVEGRDLRHIVTVETPAGIQAWYRRSGGGGTNTGGAQAGDWAPFEGFAKREGLFVYEGSAYRVDTPSWFIKHRFSHGLAESDDLYRLGTVENLETSLWLQAQQLPLDTSPTPWQTIQPELEFFGVPTVDLPFIGSF